MDPGAIAQEVVGQNRWRMAMDPTVLTVEQEKAQAAKPGSGFKECANGCPVMIVIPAGKFIMGSLESESDRDASEGPPHEVTITKPFAVSKFEVTFASFRLLYGFLVLGHSRREILWLGVTAHPSAQWIARQLSEAYGWQQAPQYIVRDRDCVYGDVFIRRVRAMGIRDRPIAPRSPWQNGHAERLIGSIRRDCLDHVVVFGERHLRHLLGSYQKYYNDARTHLSLNKDAPASRAVQAVGRIVPTPHLGGLHHQYVRI